MWIGGLVPLIAVAVLSGATGSASGGLSIAAGSLDKLPHNGAVITLLVVSQCTHKQSYRDILIVSVVIPMIALFLLVLICGLIL